MTWSCWFSLPPAGARWQAQLCPLATPLSPPPRLPIPTQEFFSVAWTALTVVTQAGHKKRWSVLAAAGLRGLVRLLHVRAGFCCGVIRAHKKAIATLCFSPTHETHLFSKTLSHVPEGAPAPCPAVRDGRECAWLVSVTTATGVSSGQARRSVARWTTDRALAPAFSP